MKPEEHIGENKIMKCGKLLTITKISAEKYNKHTLFEGVWEDGIHTKPFRWAHFNNGEVKYDNPNEHIGEINLMNNGHTLTITEKSEKKIEGTTAYLGIWEDNTTSRPFTYSNFAKGDVRYFRPKRTKISPIDKAKAHIGENFIMNCGLALEITGVSEERSKSGRYVFFGKWEDGIIAKPFEYSSYNNRSVRRPAGVEHIGKTEIMHNGLSLTITEICQNKNNKVNRYIGIWEDGSISREFILTGFKNKEVAHSTLLTIGDSNYMGFDVFGRVFEEDGKAYYRCECQKCKNPDILTPQQMIEHCKSHK